MAPLRVLIATTDGSLRPTPRPRTYTSVFAVPRATAMSRPPKPVRYEKKPIYRTSARLEKPDEGSAQAVAAPCSTQKPTLAGTFQQADQLGHGKADDVP